MAADLTEIREKLIGMIKEHGDTFRITSDKPEKFEVTGTVETMQGKQKVAGHYFSTIIPKPKDVRFYFFPAYTHKEQLGPLPENIGKQLKGKSCFHIKKWDNEIESNFKKLVDDAVALYKADGII